MSLLDDVVDALAEDRFIASTSDNRGRPMYVTEYPGEKGGKDWGYGNRENAKEMSARTAKRFKNFCRHVDRKCSVVKIS